MAYSIGSVGGTDGLRPHHLKDLLKVSGGGGSSTWSRGEGAMVEDRGGGRVGVASTMLLDRFTEFINLLLSGAEIPPFIHTYISGASLTALNKKGDGVRPIAVGVTWLQGLRV